jgi:CRISPR-associated protein Cas2
MSRTLYLICYDIADTKRLRHVHQCVLAYSVGGQKSFYECWLTAAELPRLQQQLSREIDSKLDRIHFFQLDPRMSPLFYGTARRQSVQPFMIL